MEFDVEMKEHTYTTLYVKKHAFILQLNLFGLTLHT